MAVPWMEIEQYQDPELPGDQGYPDSTWQAVFACQMDVLPYQEWVKLRWGFNAAALFEEALERQRLFLESQYSYPNELGLEPTDLRTLAVRFINRPGDGLLASIVGKIHGRTEAEAMAGALSYLNEIKSTAPYDYTLVPASSQSEFVRISGKDILENDNRPLCLAQIKRLEFSPDLKRKTPILQGFWRSHSHAHEQVWRALAGSASPLLMNITLRSTVLYESEYDYLLKCSSEVPETDGKPFDPLAASAWKQWSKQILARRLAPWKKHFYLQVHLASTQELSDHLLRTIGTSLTLNHQSELLTGYEIVSPEQQEIPYWQRRLKNLDVILSSSYLQHQRLSDVADLEEVFDVIRLPYSPPENGLPGVNFVYTGST